MIAVGRVAREEVERRLRDRGTTLRHLSALGHLSATPGSSYSELARRAGITVQSMQSTVRQLEDQGAIERTTTPGRGHTAGLRVTAAGQHLLHTGHEVFTAADDIVGANLTGEEHDLLMRLLLRSRSAAVPTRYS